MSHVSQQLASGTYDKLTAHGIPLTTRVLQVLSPDLQPQSFCSLVGVLALQANLKHHNTSQLTC